MLVSLILTRPWAGHSPGETVEVDKLRAELMLADGVARPVGADQPETSEHEGDQ